jgi:hypothetical protein
LITVNKYGIGRIIESVISLSSSIYSNIVGQDLIRINKFIFIQGNRLLCNPVFNFVVCLFPIFIWKKLSSILADVVLDFANIITVKHAAEISYGEKSKIINFITQVSKIIIFETPGLESFVINQNGWVKEGPSISSGIQLKNLNVLDKNKKSVLQVIKPIIYNFFIFYSKIIEQF